METNEQFPRLSRRAVLTTATAAAGAVAGVSAMIKGVTEVLIKATKLAPDHANKLWVQIFETAEGGWGFGGQVFVPRGQ